MSVSILNKTQASQPGKNHECVKTAEENTSGSLIIYNINNEVFRFNDTTNYFVIIKNNRYCADCFNSINSFVRNFKKESNAKFIVINLSDSTMLSRKRLISMNRKLMPDFDDYFFQYNNENKNTLFDAMNTNFTPELILIRKGEITHIPNNKIFDYPSLNVSTALQFKIGEMLK